MAGWYQFRAQHGYSFSGKADTKYTEEKIVNNKTIRISPPWRGQGWVIDIKTHPLIPSKEGRPQVRNISDSAIILGY